MTGSYGELAKSSESISKAKELFEIRIPKEFVFVAFGAHEIFIYALDSRTLGISATASEFWAEKSLWHGEAHLEDSGDYWLVVLPYPVASFYKQLTPVYKVSAYKSEKVHIFFGAGDKVD
jgi:hypothetical protein